MAEAASGEVGSTDVALLAAALSTLITHNAPRRTITTTAAAIVRAVRTSPLRSGMSQEVPVNATGVSQPKGTKKLSEAQRLRLRERRKIARTRKKDKFAEKSRTKVTTVAAVKDEPVPEHQLLSPEGTSIVVSQSLPAQGEMSAILDDGTNDNDTTAKAMQLDLAGFGASFQRCPAGGRNGVPMMHTVNIVKLEQPADGGTMEASPCGGPSSSTSATATQQSGIYCVEDLPPHPFPIPEHILNADTTKAVKELKALRNTLSVYEGQLATAGRKAKASIQRDMEPFRRRLKDLIEN